MSKLNLLLFIAVVLILGGCLTTTLHAPYSNETIVYDPVLIGIWIESESGEILKFSEGANKSYNLVYIDEENRVGQFVAYLFKIADQLFLDVYPADFETDWSDAYKHHLRPFHSFMLIEQIEPDLKLALPETDKLFKYVEENYGEIGYEKLNGDMILTSSTAELQKFIGEISELRELFGESGVFKKVTE